MMRWNVYKTLRLVLVDYHCIDEVLVLTMSARYGYHNMYNGASLYICLVFAWEGENSMFLSGWYVGSARVDSESTCGFNTFPCF